MLPRENLIKKLIASSKCEICGQHFEMKNIDVLGHEREIWFLKIRCSSCHCESLMAAVIRENRVVGLTTDLTEQEASRFKNASAISADDVLDMHNFLKDYEGDINQLLSQSR